MLYNAYICIITTIVTILIVIMRPKKTRWVNCEFKERYFYPQCKSKESLKNVRLSLDEFEVMRLTHLEDYDQIRIAEQMKIHQSTISRILASAHKKVTDALVNIKAIKIEKGCCRIIEPNSGSKVETSVKIKRSEG
jgi:uncharacterized protein